jgi:hypothetical protein
MQLALVQGEACGLVKNLALVTHVTTDSSADTAIVMSDSPGKSAFRVLVLPSQYFQDVSGGIGTTMPHSPLRQLAFDLGRGPLNY